MAKPRITIAAVTAAHDVLDRSLVPDNYHHVSSEEQRRIRMAIMREALIAAQLADQQSPPPQTRERVSDTPSAALEASHE